MITATIPEKQQQEQKGNDDNKNKKMPILRVAIGSDNPCKIDAVRRALQTCMDRKKSSSTTTPGVVLEIEGFSVASGVDDQPYGDEMTCRGAKNRSKAACMAFHQKYGYYPHLSVGMEGGVEWVCTTTSSRSSSSNGADTITAPEDNGAKQDKKLYCMAWISIHGKRQGFTVDLFACEDTISYRGDKKPYYGLAKTACFPMPPKLTQLLEQGMELGEADDLVFKRTDSKRGSGTVGILTDGIIDRAAYYEHAIFLALIPWIRPDLYP